MHLQESLRENNGPLDQALANVNKADTKLCKFIDEYLTTEQLPGQEAFMKELCIGRRSPFSGIGGLKNEQCEVVFSNVENMEGSLYVKFDNNTLRFRWGGTSDRHIYLHTDNKEEVFVISGKEGAQIRRINELEIDGQEGDTLTARMYKDVMGWKKNMLDYTRQVQEYQELTRNRIRRFVTKLRNGSLPEEPVEPKKSEPTRIPMVTAIEKLQTLTSGIEKMLNLLQQKRVEFEKLETVSNQ